MVIGKTWDVINIPIIPNVSAVQYSARDVILLPLLLDRILLRGVVIVTHS